MAHAVVTRDEAAAQPYAEALAPLGLAVVAMPVTRVAPPADPEALAAALAGDHAAIVCASARAAEALAASGRRTWPRVWAVGPATARRLADAGIPAIAPPGVRDGATLAAAMIAEGVAGVRILAPRAEEGRDDAITSLRAAGAIVDEVIAYRTVPAPADDAALVAGRELLSSGRAAVCAAFAPSQVRALDALVGIARIRTAFVAIGETTAAALLAAGVRATVAETPTPEGIAKAVASVYLQRR